MRTRHRRSTSGNRMRRAALAAPLAILLTASGCKAGSARESAACEGVPQLASRGRVTDAADLLDLRTEVRLADRLARYEKATRHQMVVVTAASLSGARVDNFGTCLGNRWGIGYCDRNYWIQFLNAPCDTQLRISTGYRRGT